MALWSNSSCIRSGGLRFDPQRGQFFPQEKSSFNFHVSYHDAGSVGTLDFKREWKRMQQERSVGDTSSLNGYQKAAGQGEMERKINNIVFMCVLL